MSTKNIITLLVGLGFCFNLLAQTLNQAELSGDFKESHSPEVLVSGVVVVGALSQLPLSGQDLKKMVISSAGFDTDPQQVCLVVSSKDGVYRSENTYNVVAHNKETPVLLPYDQSRYLKELSSYTDGDLTALATKGACTEASNEKYIVSTDGSLSTQSIRLHINSLMATDVYLSLGDKELDCDPLNGRTTNYDYVCVISAEDQTSLPLRLKVERERFGRPQATVDLVLF